MSPKIAHYALMAGLTALVPLPILDAWLMRRAHRAMYEQLSADTGAPLEPTALDLLAEDRSSLLLGCLGVVVVWPLKKLFRTVFYFLTVKDVIDGAAEAALRAAMLRSAAHRLPHDAKTVRDVMDATLDKWQYSPVSRFFFRGDRPKADWVVGGDDHAVRTLGWLYEKAGGGAILADFERRLRLAEAPFAAPAEDAPSETADEVTP